MQQLAGFPGINVPWDKLAGVAEELELRSSATAGYLADATAAWSGLQQAYRQPETEAAVHTALDELVDPVQQWQHALASARSVLEAFVTAGRLLQAESEELAAAQPGLAADLAAAEAAEAGDPAEPGGAQAATTGRVTAFNIRAEQLWRDWQALTEQTVLGLDAIRGGTGGTLPAASLLGTSSLPVPTWADFTSGLDEAFGTLSPEDYVRSMQGLSDGELHAWVLANPEAAAVLAANKLPVWRPSGSPEAIMANAMAGDNPLTHEGITGIRTAWLSLSPDVRERLLLLYPAVFGNLNGVPFANRVRANSVTIAGYREAVSSQQESHQSGSAEWDRLETLRKGLDYAADNDVQVVMVSLEGDGRIVTMEGNPGPQTRTAATLVPGTGSDLGQLENYTQRLDAINGESSASSVSFYWQGTDLPDEVPYNATSSYNEEGAPQLAAFDFALDLEIPAGTAQPMSATAPAVRCSAPLNARASTPPTSSTSPRPALATMSAAPRTRPTRTPTATGCRPGTTRSVTRRSGAAASTAVHSGKAAAPATWTPSGSRLVSSGPRTRSPSWAATPTTSFPAPTPPRTSRALSRAPTSACSLVTGSSPARSSPTRRTLPMATLAL
ncbi:hypothetical protein D477_000460 [Arthrobacter crystallopoietes BAB-32]|uniref:Uncharacterized protein n=2 Tax=Crystallibacter crystallopoietes TaxID=37928 RepID=N1VCY7_9MICC|nr:hypothetical protein D477_000460 [Arthrobacter crystallopoietes BAB-32]